MKSRTAAALLSGLGVVTGGAVWALPGLAGAAPAAAVVDSTVPDDDAPDTTTADDTTADESTPADTTAADESDDTTGAESDADTESTTETSGRSSRIEEALQPLVDDGTLTADQVAAVVDTLQEVRIGEWGRQAPIMLLDVDTLTEALGLTAEELGDALADGQTISEIAAAEGVAIDDLVAALVAAATERIDEAVANGRLTEDEATTLIDDLTERITARLERIDAIGGPSLADGSHGRGRPGVQDDGFGPMGPQSQHGQMPQGPQGPGWPGGSGGPGMPGDGPTFSDGGGSPGEAPPSVDSADATTA